ncbi:phage tail protein [Nostoc sp. CHAB 5844]|nr:phage tail protein [Nostoc sp. CHAB 5844]
MPSAWEQGRPIYKRLPIAEEKYQVAPDDPELDPVADWLTVGVDENLMAVKAAITTFYADYLDPVTAKSQNLDWLGQLCGFTGEYWETAWSDEQKRSLITNAYTFIWECKGSRAVLEYLLETFSIQGKIYLLGEFLADRNVAGDALGGEPLEYFLLLPLSYLRTSYQWRLASKFNRLYGPVYVKSVVCFSQFYCGFSVAGDPIFDSSVAF